MKIKKVSIILIKILTMKFNKNKSKVLHIKNIIAPPLAATLKIAAKNSFHYIYSWIQKSFHKCFFWYFRSENWLLPHSKIFEKRAKNWNDVEIESFQIELTNFSRKLSNKETHIIFKNSLYKLAFFFTKVLAVNDLVILCFH